MLTQSFPDGWTRHMDDMQSGLIFSTLSIDSSTLSPSKTIIVKVDNNLAWSLSYNGILVKNQSYLSNSQQIKCLNDVLILLSSIQASNICCGNSVDEFKELVDDHRGEFKDSKGCCILHAYESS